MVSVTGATGFIGTRFCSLLREQGFRVRALVRRPERAVALRELGVELVAGDLQQTGPLAELMAGCDGLVHCAGTVRGNSLDSFDATNSEGTRELLRAAALHAPAVRLLLISSLAAREPELSWYAASKRRGEELVRSSSQDWVILRPPAVYGPGDKEMKAVFDSMAHGIAPVPGDITARISLIHVDDLARAMLACLLSNNCSQRLMTLCDGKANGYDWTELAATASEVYKRKIRLVKVPIPLLNAIAAGNLQLSRLIGRAAMLTPAKLRELRHPDWVVDNREITDATAWTPSIGLREGLARLADSAF